MIIQRICTIYFSPTGTTEKIVKTIGDSLLGLYSQDGGLVGSRAQDGGLVGSHAQDGGLFGSHAQDGGLVGSHAAGESRQSTDESRQSTDESCQSAREASSLNYDFTLPANRQGFPELNSGDLVIFGIPTYAGRLPNLLLPYLNTVRGNGALAVPVVTFGNRSFDNSLIELRNILTEHGFHTIAAGAFSCEHSFSYELGKGRPDESDLALAKKFASLIHDKSESVDNALSVDKAVSVEKTCHPIPPVSVDGDAKAGYYQPRDRNGTFIDIRKVKPLTNDKCIRCGLCAELCPMGAISRHDYSAVIGKCIKCCSCYKRCPVSAKYFDDPGFLYHKRELEAMYGIRRAENKIYV